MLRQEWQSFRNPNNRSQVLYQVTPLDGTGSYVLDRADVIHLTSPGYDGLCSPSPITYAAREAVGNALSAQEFTGKFFAGGGAFDYALKTAARLDKAQLEQLKASLLGRVQNGGRGPLILTGGLEPAQLSVNAKDAEVLATRLFTVEEICAILGVPPHMIGHTSKSTSFGTGIEQQSTAFVRYTLQRHMTPIKQELNAKLWPVRQKYFVEHVTDALIAADMKARYESYRIA
ncbi:phage portal protein, partial [Massilia sp. 2TAF26]|uniref:phage portal protein n=1 Tax=Massilia sp. 2TAF26 TaxID=3233012 RepID=UPI003F982284